MSELKYNVCFTLGDPSGDGHASTSDYHMVSNYPAEEIDAAYKKATEILGFDYVKEVGSNWQDNELKNPQLSVLISKGVINPEDYEYYEENDDEDASIWLDEYDFIDIFEKICNLVLPNFVLNYRELDEEQIFSLEGAAYGIAYHGE